MEQFIVVSELFFLLQQPYYYTGDESYKSIICLGLINELFHVEQFKGLLYYKSNQKFVKIY